MEQIKLGDVEQCLLATKMILEKLHLMSLAQETAVPKLSPQGRHVEIAGDGLQVGSVVIPLNNRPMTKKLVRAFLSKSEQFLTRAEMVSFVYDVDLETLSPRMRQSLQQNLIKLLSRSRSFLENACRIGNLDDHLRWFVFDIHLQKWQLYQYVKLGN